MTEPKHLSIRELKIFHRSVREKIRCAVDQPEPKTAIERGLKMINPDYNQVKSEGRVVLRMIDVELERRGYHPEKLFKGYVKDK